MGATDEAVEFYERILAIDADNLPAHTNIAPQLERLGRFEEADAHFRRAVALNENRPPPMHNLIGYLIRSRQNDAVVSLSLRGVINAGQKIHIFSNGSRDTAIAGWVTLMPVAARCPHCWHAFRITSPGLNCASPIPRAY
jgi:tetratricopeptide (TPR) repeat protein